MHTCYEVCIRWRQTKLGFEIFREENVQADLGRELRHEGHVDDEIERVLTDGPEFPRHIWKQIEKEKNIIIIIIVLLLLLIIIIIVIVVIIIIIIIITSIYSTLRRIPTVGFIP